MVQFLLLAIFQTSFQMARVVKIDNAFKKRFERAEKKRAVESRSKRVFFLIVCEGEKTEPNYFEQFKKSLPVGSLKIQLDIKGTGRNTDSLINFAIKYRDDSMQDYDRVWAVFDRDSFKESTFNDAIQNANNNNIQVAWTNEAFELWLLLHFQFVSHSMNRADYQKFLEREISAKSGRPYTYLKNAVDTHKMVTTYGSQEKAIQWAKKLEKEFTCTKYASHNPCTKIHHLVAELEDPSTLLKKN